MIYRNLGYNKSNNKFSTGTKKMKYVFLFLLLIASLFHTSQASVYTWSRDKIVYNYRFCKGNLGRVVSAALKKPLYKGCLRQGLAKLEGPKSRLHRMFAYEYNPGNTLEKPIIAKGTRGYSSKTRAVVVYALKERLGEVLPEKDPTLTQRTEKGKERLEKDLADLCAMNEGSTVLLKAFRGEGGARHSKAVGNSSLVRAYVHAIDVYRLFPELRQFLMTVSSRKYMKDPEHKKVVRRLKSLKEKFLININSVIVLKERLNQKSRKDTNEKKEVAFNALATLLAFGKHYSAFEDAMKIIDPKFSEENIKEHGSRSEYKNLVFFMDLGRRIRLLNTECHPKRH